MVALDCEMVQTDRGSELGHIVVVDELGQQIGAWHVRPQGEIIDLLTKFSGIKCIEEITGPTAIDFRDLGPRLAAIGLTKSTYIVGHGLEADVKAMKLLHHNVIDSAILFHHAGLGHKRQKLSLLAATHLNRSVQDGCHDPSEDAIAALDLVRVYQESIFNMDILYARADAAKVDLSFMRRQVPAQLDRMSKTFVPPTARQCHKCGEVGHMKAQCPVAKGKQGLAKGCSRNSLVNRPCAKVGLVNP